MNAIESLCRRLERLPGLRYRADGNSITVDAPSPQGFSISLQVRPSGYLVSLDRWQQRFHCPQQALRCVALGLSDECRIKVVRRGDVEHRWTLECLTDEGWEQGPSVQSLLFPFWRRREVVYRSNAVI